MHPPISILPHNHRHEKPEQKERGRLQTRASVHKRGDGALDGLCDVGGAEISGNELVHRIFHLHNLSIWHISHDSKQEGKIVAGGHSEVRLAIDQKYAPSVGHKSLDLSCLI